MSGVVFSGTSLYVAEKNTWMYTSTPQKWFVDTLFNEAIKICIFHIFEVLILEDCAPVADSDQSSESQYMYRVEQRKHIFFKWLVLGNGGVDDVRRDPSDNSDNAVSEAIAHWNVEHRVFAIEQFI